MYKVLLADDEPLILAGLHHKIDWEELGFTIAGECLNGSELLDAIRRVSPDLLILDIQMPQKTGLQVLQEIEHVSPVLSIVISGYSNFSYAQEALHLGVIDYLTKPVSASVLRTAVLKAKQRLDLSTDAGRHQTGLLFQFLRLNMDRMSDADLLGTLSLTGEKRWAWIAAFHNGCTLRDRADQEVSWIRYDDDTVLALIRSDLPPENDPQALTAGFSFDGCAGISHPMETLRMLPVAADEAVACLRTSWFTPGIYLWPTENADSSVRYYLKQLWSAEGQDGRISEMLSALPSFLQEHRLNIWHAEAICSAVFARAGMTNQEYSIAYRDWEQITAAYPTADALLTDLRRTLLPEHRESDTATSSRAIVFRIRTLLQEHYAQPLSLRQMSERFHIDMSYLSSLFHEETGKTFTAYLTELRVQHACEYLRTTSLSNARIAQLCGFASDSYMKKVFRKVMGVTPSAYRDGGKTPSETDFH